LPAIPVPITATRMGWPSSLDVRDAAHGPQGFQKGHPAARKQKADRQTAVNNMKSS
jgi:hypothetical protein